MGTRSVTKIYRQDADEEPKLVMALYKQFDGYPEGWGKSLKEFFKTGTFVNGLSSKNKGLLFNGAGDFALLLVKEFKTESGDLYATVEDDEQEVNYKITFITDKEWEPLKVIFECLEEKKYNEVFKVIKDGKRTN